MKNEQLEFVIANDPENNFELMQEVWLDNQQIADLRLVEGAWKVTFFANDRLPEMPWSLFEEIYQTFQKFMLSHKDESSKNIKN